MFLRSWYTGHWEPCVWFDSPAGGGSWITLTTSFACINFQGDERRKTLQRPRTGGNDKERYFTFARRHRRKEALYATVHREVWWLLARKHGSVYDIIAADLAFLYGEDFFWRRSVYYSCEGGIELISLPQRNRCTKENQFSVRETPLIVKEIKMLSGNFNPKVCVKFSGIHLFFFVFSKSSYIVVFLNYRWFNYPFIEMLCNIVEVLSLLLVLA